MTTLLNVFLLLLQYEMINFQEYVHQKVKNTCLYFCSFHFHFTQQTLKCDILWDFFSL